MADITKEDLAALASELDNYTFNRPEQPLTAMLDENGVVIISDSVTGDVKMMMSEADWWALRAYPTKTFPKPLPMSTMGRLKARQRLYAAEDEALYARIDAMGRGEGES